MSTNYANYHELKEQIKGQATSPEAYHTIHFACIITVCSHFQKTGSRVTWFSQIYADKSRRLPRIDIMGGSGFATCLYWLDTCPYPALLIRVNLCNLWMIILKDWIPGQARLARDDTAFSMVDLFTGSFSPFHLS